MGTGRRATVDRDGNNEGSGHNPERSPLHHAHANRQASRESVRQGAGSEASIPRNSRGRNSGVARMEEPVRGNSILHVHPLLL